MVKDHAADFRCDPIEIEVAAIPTGLALPRGTHGAPAGMSVHGALPGMVEGWIGLDDWVRNS